MAGGNLNTKNMQSRALASFTDKVKQLKLLSVSQQSITAKLYSRLRRKIAEIALNILKALYWSKSSEIFNISLNKELIHGHQISGENNEILFGAEFNGNQLLWDLR